MRRLAISIALLAACLVPAATASAVTVDPASKDFGAVTLGTASPTTSFTLTPAGDVSTGPLQGGPGTTFTAYDFAIHNVDCPYPSFAGGGAQSSCQFTAGLTPTGVGARSFQLTFGDTMAPLSATVDLTGSGIAPPSPPPGASPAKRKKCKKKHRRAAAAKKKCKKKR